VSLAKYLAKLKSTSPKVADDANNVMREEIIRRMSNIGKTPQTEAADAAISTFYKKNYLDNPTIGERTKAQKLSREMLDKINDHDPLKKAENLAKADTSAPVPKAWRHGGRMDKESINRWEEKNPPTQPKWPEPEIKSEKEFNADLTKWEKYKALKHWLTLKDAGLKSTLATVEKKKKIAEMLGRKDSRRANMDLKRDSQKNFSKWLKKQGLEE
jgi:hypothetical protein